MSTPASPPVGAVAIRTLTVVAIFGIYAIIVAFAPIQKPRSPGITTMAGPGPAGPRAWRAAGCHFCHSLYGLGGHTGPDLTNVISRTSAGYVRAVVRSGLPGMPDYRHLAPSDLDLIVGYLAEVDHTATYPPRKLSEGVFGDR